MTVKQWITSFVLMATLAVPPLQAVRDEAGDDSWGSRVTRFFYPHPENQDGCLRHSIAAGKAHIFLTDAPSALLRLGAVAGWVPPAYEQIFNAPRQYTLALSLLLGYRAALEDERQGGVQKNINEARRQMLFGLMAAYAYVELVEISSYDAETPSSFFPRWAPTLIRGGIAYAWHALATAEMEHD